MGWNKDLFEAAVPTDNNVYLQTSTQCLVVELNLPMGLNIGVARIGTDLAALLLLEYGHVLATDYVNCSWFGDKLYYRFKVQRWPSI